MDKGKKSVQFSVDVFDERDTRCGIALCPTTVFSDLRFLLPLCLAVLFVQGIISSHLADKKGIQMLSIYL